MSETHSLESAEIPKRVVVAAIIVENGQLLLVKNIKHGLRYEPTGGKVKPDETPEEAVVREAHEELDIDVRVVRLIGVYDTQSPEGEFEVHTFECEIVGGRPRENMDPAIGGFEWANADRFLELDRESGLEGRPVLVPNLRLALRDVLPLLERR